MWVALQTVPEVSEKNNVEHIPGTRAFITYSRTNNQKNTQAGAQLLIWQFGARTIDLALTEASGLFWGGAAWMELIQ